MPSPDTSIKPRPRHPRWPWIIIALLGGHVVLMSIAVTMAERDKHFAVVPDYYQKAVHWDQEQDQLRASHDLGWRVQILPASTIDPTGQRRVTFFVTDKDSKPIDNAVVEVSYFHHAHGDQTHTKTLSQSTAGRYDETLPMRYAGLWEFHFTVTAAGKSFVQSNTQWIDNASR